MGTWDADIETNFTIDITWVNRTEWNTLQALNSIFNIYIFKASL